MSTLHPTDSDVLQMWPQCLSCGVTGKQLTLSDHGECAMCKIRYGSSQSNDVSRGDTSSRPSARKSRALLSGQQRPNIPQVSGKAVLEMAMAHKKKNATAERISQKVPKITPGHNITKSIVAAKKQFADLAKGDSCFVFWDISFRLPGEATLRKVRSHSVELSDCCSLSWTSRDRGRLNRPRNRGPTP